MVTDLLRAEVRAMNVIPSLPATEVARTRWYQLSEGTVRRPAATVALTRAGMPFTLHPYTHDPRAQSYGLEAAHALGVAQAGLQDLAGHC